MKSQKNFISGAVVRQQITNFYQKPVARVSAELFFSIITVSFFAFFALRPTIITMTKLVKEIEDKRTLEEGLTKKISALSTAQNEYITYQDRFAILDTAYHANFTLQQALFYIEYLIGQQNVKLESLRIDEYPINLVASGSATVQPKVVREGTVQAQAITLTFSGRYEDILQFLQAVEQVRPLFSVLGFSLQRPQSSSGRLVEGVDSSILSASAIIQVYSLGEKKATPAPAQQRRATDEVSEESL